MLKANLEIAKDSNRILRKMERAQRNATIARVIYWILILGITIGAFYYIQPYINKFTALVPGLDKALSNLDFSKLNNLITK